MTEEGDLVLIGTKDAVNAVFIFVAQTLQKIVAVFLNRADGLIHAAFADAGAFAGALIGNVDIAVFTENGILQTGNGFDHAVGIGRFDLIADLMCPLLDVAFQSQQTAGRLGRHSCSAHG